MTFGVFQTAREQLGLSDMRQGEMQAATGRFQATTSGAPIGPKTGDDVLINAVSRADSAQRWMRV